MEVTKLINFAKLCKCCNRFAGVVLKCTVHHEQNVHKEQHHINVARISNNGVILVSDLLTMLVNLVNS